MKLSLLSALVCATVVALTSPASAEDAALAGDDLRRTVAGRTIVLDTPVGGIPIVYQLSGALSGTAKGMPAHLMQGPSQDHGRWWIAAGTVCQQWSTWLEGRKHCYQMRVRGKMVQWRREDGRTGTARIVSN